MLTYGDHKPLSVSVLLTHSNSLHNSSSAPSKHMLIPLLTGINKEHYHANREYND